MSKNDEVTSSFRKKEGPSPGISQLERDADG